jgi:hypothetical protein
MFLLYITHALVSCDFDVPVVDDLVLAFQAAGQAYILQL